MTLGNAPHMELPIMAQENGVDFIVSSDPLATVILNNITARDLGLKVGQVTSWLDAPAQELPTLNIPGLAGSVHTDDRPKVSPIELHIAATIVGADAADVRARRDRLVTLLRAQPVTVVLPDSQTTYRVADLATVQTEPVGASFVQTKFPVTIVLRACDPYRYDLWDTVAQAAAGVAARLPMGTAPVRPVLTISGPAVNPVVTFTDYAGNVIGTFTLTVVLVAGDVLVVDCAAGTIKKNGVDSYALLTAGDLVQLDPAIHADRDTLRWPIVTCSAGVMATRYRRAWS